MRFFRLVLAVLAGLLALRAIPARAMSSEERETTFWKVAVIDFKGRTPAIGGDTAGVRFAASLRNSKRFHVVDPQSVRRAVRNGNIDISEGKLSESDAKKICKALRVDGVFAGRIEKTDKGGALTIALYSGATGRLFAQYRFPMSAQFPLAEAATVAAGYTERLPYDGLVVSVRRDLALINLGTANGLANGSKVYAFEFAGASRGDAGSMIAGARKALAELEVVRAEQHGAWVRPLRGDMPEEFTKISLKPVAGAAELKPMVQSTTTATPYVAFEADADVAFLFKSYQLSGTGATFKSNTTLFPAPGFHVAWFPTASLGGEFRLRHGFIPFRRPVGVGPNKKIQTYSGSIDQAILEFEARKVFGGSGVLAGGSLTGGFGVDYASFKIQSQNPIVLSNDTYLGPILTGDLRVPLLDAITLRTGLGVVPFANLSQTPVDNGKGSVLGLHGTLGLDYHINDRLFMAFDYGVDSLSTKFPTAGGSRNLQNAKSTDLYHGVTLTLGWRSYR